MYSQNIPYSKNILYSSNVRNPSLHTQYNTCSKRVCMCEQNIISEDKPRLGLYGGRLYQISEKIISDTPTLRSLFQ